MGHSEYGYQNQDGFQGGPHLNNFFAVQKDCEVPRYYCGFQPFFSEPFPAFAHVLVGQFHIY